MAKSKVFQLDPYYEDALKVLDGSNAVELIRRDDTRKENWHSEADAIIIRSETRIKAEDISRAKKLKVIAKQGVGVDNIDLEAAKAHGVAVCNTPALNSESVAELTLSLALAVSRRIVEMDRKIRSGERIIRSTVLGHSLFKKTIGIIGMGNIGSVLASKWAAAMQGSVIGFDPFAPENAWSDIKHQRVHDLGELLQNADVVTLHVPLTNGTRKLIGKAQFQQMKRSAIFLNAARGGIVDEAALLEALSEKLIYGAALDAMEVEPPTLEAYGKLLQYENLVMTPHIGGNTVENQIISGTRVAETVIEVLEGKDVPNRLV